DYFKEAINLASFLSDNNVSKMNKIIIIKRNYNPLIQFLTLISLFLIVRQLFVFKFESLEIELSEFYRNNDYKNSYDTSIYNEITNHEIFYGIVIVLFALFNFLMLVKRFKTKENKYSLFLLEFVIVWIIFAFTSTELKLNTIKEDNYFISLLIFFPYFHFIYVETILGTKLDITEQVKKKELKKYSDDILDLHKLHEKDLISVEEYNNKLEIQSKEKLRKEIKETEEYTLLLQAKQKNLITEDEFNVKIENLINKIFKSEKEKIVKDLINKSKLITENTKNLTIENLAGSYIIDQNIFIFHNDNKFEKIGEKTKLLADWIIIDEKTVLIKNSTFSTTFENFKIIGDNIFYRNGKTKFTGKKQQ
ncbi:MAG: hypothetical protein ACOVQR_12900, partial [Flavobacterium sp.]|uniref:hypothetical protein n=1 Tax=Flavobacterium sp. TaxID=239 RepID=UPI003BA64D7E